MERCHGLLFVYNSTVTMAVDYQSKSKSPRKEKVISHVPVRQDAENWRMYQETKKTAKKGIAAPKAAHYDDLSDKVETRDDERHLYRLAKARCRQAEDIEKFLDVNDHNDHLLTNRKRAMRRWHDYFEEISTVEFDHPSIPCVPPTRRPVQKITLEEAKQL
ncbi:unnamed protein product [Heligmosomoides polygyrus]|uniref:Uncharacterized protein n=1 Tax=Heligmosomoides polygyrus TaxID=6339 RepID=A0A183GM61_HELPZ|nr:unnamed protein product [Heligmosomoides polygyrus]